ncbi:amidohydrolase [Paracoccus beibuensis]|uniref:amidohydrolase n=1 Tax=Paracoccus beibuensis TaxID=547602 RepID=UPI002240828F|nr:amidohydrolase [Paracoccus beibuensis]
MSDIAVYAAKKILTMDHNQPTASHVAVRDGRVLAVGDRTCADPWGGGRLDDRFTGSVILPGFVEGHSHLMEGGLWRYAYVGFQDRYSPEGELWPGLASNDELVARLQIKDQGNAVVGWGFDPIFLKGPSLSRDDLDRVSTDRPVVVLFSNLHLLVCNTAALRMAGYEDALDVEGVMRDGSGRPTGELREMAAMFPVLRRTRIDFRDLTAGTEVLHRFARSARRAGITTATDLFSALTPPDIAATSGIVEAEDFPIRLIPALGIAGGAPEGWIEMIEKLRLMSGEKLRLGAAKLMTDGSIQGFSARLKWPGYLTGAPNGMWNMAPAELREMISALHAAGIQMHVHVNGDEASELVIDAMAQAMRGPGPRDHRHVLQHGQLMDEAQFRRAAELGLAVNLFANHIYHFGDQHYERTVGPDRAIRMNACRSALDAGLQLAIHSDAPVTPLSPLFTAWCAVNRLTASGRVLGASQSLSVQEALYAITMGAAWTLRMDHEIGSIEVGKRADFVVLDEDPIQCPASNLKDIGVRATIVGGRVFE